jgi:small-conductance mechanosensitive channel
MTPRFALSIGIVVILIILFLVILSFLYSRLHKWAKKTTTQWDDIIIHNTQPLFFSWSIWLSIYTGLQYANLTTQWSWVYDKVTPCIFIALGVYTITIALMLFLKWFSLTIAKETKSKFDDILIAILKFGIPIIFSFLGLVFILDICGIDVQSIKSWLSEYAISLSLIIAIGVAALLSTTFLIPHFIHTSITKLKVEETEEELKKRSETLVSVLTAVIQVIIIIIVFLMIMSELGRDIWTILAGLSVVGVAVGFGAQSLVKDIIAGLFIIFENQYRKGDVVKIADISGLVEEINLRRTILRDLDGIVHVVPNGEIRVASNFTKVWSRVNINISVAYNTDLDRAISVINRVGKELAEDPKWSEAILTPPKFLRVDNLGDSGIELKILGETKPIRQWEVMGELRLRLKREFDKEGIEIPWPHVKLYFGS